MMALLRSPHHTATLPRDALLKHTLHVAALDFKLPPELEASEPPEARGLTRDDVRLMISYGADTGIVNPQLRALDIFLRAGAVRVTTPSGTMTAPLTPNRPAGPGGKLPLPPPPPADLWIVE